jgi:hypothetical protein
MSTLYNPKHFFIRFFRVARSLVFCVEFCKSLFILYHLTIVLYVRLRFTDIDYLFGIFKLFVYIQLGKIVEI